MSAELSPQRRVVVWHVRHSGTILGTKPEHNSTQRQTEITDNGLPLSINVESTGIHVYGGGEKEKKLFMGTIRLHPIKMVVIPELTIIICNFRCNLSQNNKSGFRPG